MGHLFLALNALHYLIYPVFYILNITFILLAVITAPLLHLGHYFLYACYYPIHLLAKFETLYIFLGVAVLVGILTGTSLHYASSYLIAFLSLEKRPEQQRGRTLASYRRDKQDKRKDTSPKLDYELGGRAGGNAMSRRISTDSLASSMDVPGKLKISDGNSQRFDAMLKEETMEFEWPKKGRKRANNDLIPNTILEEDSTEDDL